MKVTCTQENFKKAISGTERVIGKQTTLPILENILLETEKGMLKVAATNLEIGIFLKIGAKIEKEGKITIPAKLLSNFINNLPPKENIQIESIDQSLKISSGKYKAVIKGLSAQEFPIIPELEGKFLFSLSGSVLRNEIPKLLSCVSLDGARPELGGVNVLLKEENIIFAATDSFRLLETSLSLKKENKEEYSVFLNKINSFIVPATTMAEIARAINPETEEVRISIEENQIFIQIDNIRIISRLINGKYPEYRQIIPKEFSTKIFVNKEDLLRAVRISSFFTDGKSGEISFSFEGKSELLTVFSQSEEKGESKVSIKVEFNGVDQEIVFNPRYVIDGINNISSFEVAILANSGSSPVVMRPISSDTGKKIEEKSTYVVMPIKN